MVECSILQDCMDLERMRHAQYLARGWSRRRTWMPMMHLISRCWIAFSDSHHTSGIKGRRHVGKDHATGLGWEFRFWITIRGSGGIWNSASDFGIPEILGGIKIGKLKNVLSPKSEFRFRFRNSGHHIQRNLLLYLLALVFFCKLASKWVDVSFWQRP